MIRALSILVSTAVLAAVSAFAVSAAFAAANDEWRKAPTPRSLGAAGDLSHLSLRKAPPKPLGLDIGTAERLDMNARVLGIVTNNNDPDTMWR